MLLTIIISFLILIPETAYTHAIQNAVLQNAVLENKALENNVLPQEAKRPTILFNRWQEDWSVLANPNVPCETLDHLKYIPLCGNDFVCGNDPNTYLSLGADWRNRYEYNNAMEFGVGPLGKKQSYIISRMEAHADLHIANQIQIFAQLQNDYAPGKTIILPVDQDRLDLEQGFITLVEPIGEGLFKFRAGRQQMAFDLQRFISVRDGPNVRQSYDAVWADYETKEWRYISFYSHPVQTRNRHCFDDFSSDALTYGGFRIEHKFNDEFKISSYISHLKEDNVVFPFVAGNNFIAENDFITGNNFVTGNDRRNILDIRFVGKGASFDWDFETMGQAGHAAHKKVRAWAVGSVSGFTFEDFCLQPRIGLQFDAASGNRNKNSNTFRTFNPLFPNGQYFTLAGYTGYTNLIHLKPSITLTPCETIKTMFAIAGQWRESTKDAVYVQPDIPVPGTAERPGQYTGTYFQARFDWQINNHLHQAIEVVQFNVADIIRRAGGHNSTYVGVELKMDW